MFNYIKADIYRIFHKRSNLVYWGILAVLFITFVLLSVVDYSGKMAQLMNIYYELAVTGLVVAGVIILCPQFYYAVYLDELNSKSFTRIFSSGLRKSEYMVAKIIVSLLYMLSVFFFLTLVYLLTLGLIMVLHQGMPFLTTQQAIHLFSIVGFLMFFTIAFSAVNNVIALKLQTSNLSLTLFFFFSLGIVHSLITTVNKLPVLNKVSLEPYLLSTNLDKIQSKLIASMIMAGRSGQSSMGGIEASFNISKGTSSLGAKPFIIVALYIVAASVISYIVLQHSDIKES